eukprot:CAMPEP_0119405326 /NCGR_PEP_ID=MMETSP1334-20130426/144341_1 /TAXON_ID=127549 /ORGANISM="Calcidiscus leptoporus, Strain RCC1130" /LENGTH=182 /DNA_ID=CAMNT_0007429297 /DNA_START=137 /DNA_END=686 /DNA_ORIENTATION=-
MPYAAQASVIPSFNKTRRGGDHFKSGEGLGGAVIISHQAKGLGGAVIISHQTGASEGRADAARVRLVLEVQHGAEDGELAAPQRRHRGVARLDVHFALAPTWLLVNGGNPLHGKTRYRLGGKNLKKGSPLASSLFFSAGDPAQEARAALLPMTARRVSSTGTAQTTAVSAPSTWARRRRWSA